MVAVYQLSQVSKSFQQQVLCDINLTIHHAATCMLLGPSGCGKTSLLRLLAALEPITSGELLYQGTAIPATPQAQRLYQQQIGYVIQDGGLFPHLSGEQNLALAAQYLGWSAAAVQQRIEELVNLVHLPLSVLQRYPHQMSGGQQQRIALMRALMLDPPVLLLDEPLGALDPIIRYELQEDLKAIFSELNKTVVFVTHDLAEAAWFGDHIVLMEQGRIAQQGHFRDLHDQPASDFVQRFIQAQRGHSFVGLQQ